MDIAARYLLEHADELGERFVWSVDDLVPLEAADILIGAGYSKDNVRSTRGHAPVYGDGESVVEGEGEREGNGPSFTFLC